MAPREQNVISRRRSLYTFLTWGVSMANLPMAATWTIHTPMGTGRIVADPSKQRHPGPTQPWSAVTTCCSNVGVSCLSSRSKRFTFLQVKKPAKEEDEDAEFDEEVEWEEEDDDEEEEDAVDEEKDADDDQYIDDDEILSLQKEGVEEEDDFALMDEKDNQGVDEVMWEGALEEETVGGSDNSFSVASGWDGDDVDYPLEDDLDDPNYMQQKALLEAAIEESDRVARDRNFDDIDFMLNRMDEQQMEAMDQMPFIQEARARAQQFEVSDADVEQIDLEEDISKFPDLRDEPYPRHEEGETNLLEQSIGVTDDDMESVDKAWKLMKEKQLEEPWDKVMLRARRGFEGLSNSTLQEMLACLRSARPGYNWTDMLLYDLDFNVTNLMLAAVKHNRDAPILFQHWYPQLVTYQRYKSAQERDFDFTWDDVENADVTELERYYKGMGYDEIPQKAPAETGIVEFDYLDEEEMKMAAFESWYKDVYNPEDDRKDLDDEDFEDEDNPFSPRYEDKLHPDLPILEEAQDEIEQWNQRMGANETGEDNPELQDYRDMIGQTMKYEEVKDEEFEKEFRGHLIVACRYDDADLAIAEKITLAMNKAFGKQIYVETQVHPHAQVEDNVFEVWLESYEVELLHSKKRATSVTADWTGPAECDDKQIEYLVDRVGFLISDEARYAYSYEVDCAV